MMYDARGMNSSRTEILSTPESLTQRFESLFRTSNRVQIVSAWATCGPLRWLEDSPASIEAVIGVSKAVTDPKALRQLDERCNLWIAEEPRGAIFHPKLYLFQGGSQRIAIVGSPNFTAAAFCANKEIALLIEPDDPLWEQLQGTFEELRLEATSFDEFDMEKYGQKHRESPLSKLTELEKNTKSSVNRGARRAPPSTIGALLSMNWPSYLAYLRQHQRFQRFDTPLDNPSFGYLFTLRSTRELVNRPFSALNQEDRRKLLGSRIAQDKGYAQEYGWFGNLTDSARASCPGLLDGTNQAALSTLDWLATSTGPRSPIDECLAVGQEFFHRLTALDGFKTAFATRFLALKRPDVFCSVNGRSRRKFAELFRRPVEAINAWDGYADCLRKLQQSPWYKSTRPPALIESELWDARVALIDAYVYDPEVKDE